MEGWRKNEDAWDGWMEGWMDGWLKNEEIRELRPGLLTPGLENAIFCCFKTMGAQTFT